jgi:hypothetical protein
MARFVPCDGAHRARDRAIRGVGRLPGCDGGAQRLANAAFACVLAEQFHQRARMESRDEGPLRAASEASGQRRHRARMSPLVLHRALRRPHQGSRRLVRPQLAREAPKSHHARRFEVGASREVTPERRALCARHRSAKPGRRAPRAATAALVGVFADDGGVTCSIRAFAASQHRVRLAVADLLAVVLERLAIERRRIERRELLVLEVGGPTGSAAGAGGHRHRGGKQRRELAGGWSQGAHAREHSSAAPASLVYHGRS